MKLSLALVLACALAAFAAAGVRHESHNMPKHFTEVEKAMPDEMMTFRMSLHMPEGAKDEMLRILADSSNVRSINYLNRPSRDELNALIAPPLADRQRLRARMAAAGAKCQRTDDDTMKCTASVKVIDELFSADMWVYKHRDNEERTLRARDGYTVPAELSDVLNAVPSFTMFPPRRHFPKHRTPESTKVGTIDGCVTPWYLQNLYDLPEALCLSNPGGQVSQSVLEFSHISADLGEGLETFWDTTSVPSTDDIQVLGEGIEVGGGEQTLDIDYISGTSACSTQYYQSTSATASWYDWASDLYDMMPDGPLVNSISWGQGDESGPIEESEVGFAKLATVGVTVAVASGDQGAPGTGSCELLQPEYPGTSAYTLSVGATMTTADGSDHTSTPACSDTACTEVGGCATGTTEIVCQLPDSGITSGGGFSNEIAQPDWQSTLVNEYLLKSDALPPSAFFDDSGRGYPDISASGNLYWIYLFGSGGLVDGTSASTPVISAITSYVNDELFSAGHDAIGFINPSLYTAFEDDESNFNDVTSGTNSCTEAECCDDRGFEATSGWDGSTGLGSPNSGALASYIVDAADNALAARRAIEAVTGVAVDVMKPETYTL